MCAVVPLLIASTVLSTAGVLQQGASQAAASRYQAQVGQMNATIAENRARDAVERGKLAEQQKRLEVAKVVGQQTAAMAANGVDASFGSPLDTIVDTAKLGELDALTIRSNAYREEYDYKVQAANARAGSSLSNMQASSALTSSYIGAGSTLLGGAANATYASNTGKTAVGKVS